MYEDYSWNDVKNADRSIQEEIINELLNHYGGISQMAKALGISSPSISGHLYRLKKSKTNVNYKPQNHRKSSIKNVSDEKVEKEVKKPEPIINDSGFSIRLIGEMTTEEVQERILNIANVLSKNMKYQISFEIKEIGKNDGGEQ